VSEKIDKEVNQDGPDKGCEEEALPLREAKRGKTALSIIGMDK
jgi:hypothetical protein